MKKIYIACIVLVLAAAAVFGAVRYFKAPVGPAPIDLTDTDQEATGTKKTGFGDPITYQCLGGKTIVASYGPQAIRLTLSDARQVTLDQVSMEDESGVQYADKDGKTVFWAKDESAFLEEMGTTTHAACRAFPLAS